MWRFLKRPESRPTGPTFKDFLPESKKELMDSFVVVNDVSTYTLPDDWEILLYVESVSVEPNGTISEHVSC